MSFIDSHREDLGIEPIYRELAVAPSSYHEHARRLADPDRRPAHARHDDEIKRVHEASSGLYGARKVWHQLLRDGVAVARCAVAPDGSHGAGGRSARQDDDHHGQQPQSAVSIG